MNWKIGIAFLLGLSIGGFVYSPNPTVVDNIADKVKVNSTLIKTVENGYKEMYFILWKDGYMEGGEAAMGQMREGGKRFTEQYSIDSLRIQAIINK